MSGELLQVVAVQKIIDRGGKYYQVIIGRLGFRRPWGHRALHRKCRTATEAQKYGQKVINKLHLRTK